VAPSHASAVCKGGGEALIGGVRAGLLSREISYQFRVLTSSPSAEGNTASGVFASCWWTLRGQRSQARTQVSMRENREIPRSPAVPTDASSYGFAGWWCGAWRAVRGTLRR
jgi:hypothetical protein